MRNMRFFSLRALGFALVLAAAAFWIWAFSPWARSSHPDTLENRSFTMEAEKVCAEIFPNGEWEPGKREYRSPEERAVFAERANLKMQGMLEDLRRLQTGTKLIDDDRKLVIQWFADWQSYLEDRITWANRLSNGEDVPLRIRAVDDARPRSRIEIFTQVNRMSGCAVPDFV